MADASADRRLLHDAVQQAVSSPELFGEGQGSVVTRWQLTAEIAMPNDRLGLTLLSNDSSGAELRTWEAAGMLLVALVRVLIRGIR